MMYWYGAHVGGWEYGLGVLAMLLFWGAVIVAIIAIVRYVGYGRRGEYPREPPAAPARPPRAEEILAERFARGEIDVGEYRERLDVLHHGGGQEKEPAEAPQP